MTLCTAAVAQGDTHKMSRQLSLRSARWAIPRTARLTRTHLLFACLVLGVLAPTPALAHVKWFTDPAL